MTDFTLKYRNGETVGQLRPNNDSAKDWLGEHAQSEPWQWLGDWFCIEHRYVQGIVRFILDAGYSIERTEM